MFKQIDIKSYFILLVCILSLTSFGYFYFNNELNLANVDARSRLNIALRVTQNLTPGLAQLGGVWLPFPQLLEAPFVVIPPLYHTGLAGYLISGLAFVLACYFVFSILELISKNKWVGLLGGLIFATSINILYIQTTALSEMLIITTNLGAVYFLLLWAYKNRLSYLIIAGGWVMAATLTRYEGYALLALSLLVVPIIAIYKRRVSGKPVQGLFIMYVTVASLGVLLWLVYNWAIFGNPFQSFLIYLGNAPVISGESIKGVTAASEKVRSFSGSIISLATVSLEMVGLFTFFYGVVGLVFWIVSNLIDLKSKRFAFINELPLVLFLSPLLFLWVAFYGGSSGVKYPGLNLEALYSNDFSLFNEVNIRYGIQALPFAVIFTALLASKSKILYSFIAIICLLQVGTYFMKDINLIFSLPVRYAHAFPQEKSTYAETVDWLRKNYDGGLVMLSVNSNDPAAFYFPIPYKNYVFEGTNKYWKNSIKNPAKHARWVIMQNVPKPEFIGGAGSTDLVAYYLMDTPALTENFDLVHEDKYFLVYKIKQ